MVKTYHLMYNSTFASSKSWTQDDHLRFIECSCVLWPEPVPADKLDRDMVSLQPVQITNTEMQDGNQLSVQE